MIGLIGKKIGMTQIFDENGKVIPVTLVKAGPCTVVQRKQVNKDGYSSVQMGFEECPEKRVKKPLQGHFKKNNVNCFRHLKEFLVESEDELKSGDVVDLDIFQLNDMIKITGISKGKGFQGVMKRHGFKGFIASHGVHESFRGGGSVGQCAQPSRIFKGVKMPGHMGSEQITVKSVKVIRIDKDNNLIMVKGPVPGGRNGVVYLYK